MWWPVLAEPQQDGISAMMEWNQAVQCAAGEVRDVPKAWDVSLEMLPGDSASLSCCQAALVGRLQPSLLGTAEVIRLVRLPLL